MAVFSPLGHKNPYQADRGAPLPIQSVVPARAGLIGNPSDGYDGKTISVVVNRFAVRMTLDSSDCLDIRTGGHTVFTAANVGELRSLTERSGYQGESALVQAAIAHFCERCRFKSIDIRGETFAIEYESDIPRGVGLAGSSALIIATLNCLVLRFGIHLAPYVIAEIALDVEMQEFGIAAGLQDRVIQAYGGCMYMDFHRELVQFRGYGRYERIDTALLPPLLVAYRPELAEDSSVTHNGLRERWLAREPKVREAMVEFAELTEKAYELLKAGRGGEIGPLMDRNFDLRASLYDVGDGNRDMVAAARSLGAHAKLTGSGGAIVATPHPGVDIQRIVDGLGESFHAFQLEFAPDESLRIQQD